MTNEEVVLRQLNRGNKKYSLQKEIIMTDEQIQEQIRIVNHAISVLNKQIVNLSYTLARMSENIHFIMTHSSDEIREKRKHLDNDFYAAQQIIETDKIK